MYLYIWKGTETAQRVEGIRNTRGMADGELSYHLNSNLFERRWSEKKEFLFGDSRDVEGAMVSRS